LIDVDVKMISEADALAAILKRVNPLPSRCLPLSESIGLFAGKSLSASAPLPAFDNSAMDGYAISRADLEKGKRLRVTAEQPAGLDRNLEVRTGETVRVFTGAPIPSGTVAIVMQEEVERSGELAVLLAQPEDGEFIRRRGCDLAEGQEIVAKGQRVTPIIAGLLASQGFVEVEVGSPARVALISTGDEVVPAGTPRAAGQIFESNSVLLRGMLKQLGAEVVSAVHSPDDPEKLRKEVEAAASSDVLILTGGVSVGERDFVQEVLRSAGGEIDIWRVAIKPGKPFLSGRLKDRFVFGLPGNPVSAFVTFLMLVRPAILKLMGASPRALGLSRIRCELLEDVLNEGDRAHYFRGRHDASRFSLIGRQESHALFGLSRCNGLLRVEPGGRLSAGSAVEIETWE
jgi:molybdopterin molybdotransferase